MLHLIRHASAGHRSGALSDDERALDDHGKAQAGRIAEYLLKGGIETVLSSPSLRCRQTVGPLAEQLGVDVETSQALYEGRGAAMALALVHQLAGQGTTAALCSHGDVIPHLLDLLAAEGVESDRGGCTKGSIWTLVVEEAKIVQASYTAAP